MKDLYKIAEQLVNLTVLEAKELMDILLEEHGIEPFIPTNFISEPKQEKSKERIEISVMLKAIGGQKLRVIKEIKEILFLGLKDAKYFVDSTPVEIKKDISMSEAQSIKNQLEEVGAEVEIMERNIPI